MADNDLATSHLDFYNDLLTTAESQGDYKENAFFDIFCDEIWYERLSSVGDVTNSTSSPITSRTEFASSSTL